MNWQPIETAPKDGTPILGARFATYFSSVEKFPLGATMQWEGGLCAGRWAYTGLMVQLVDDDQMPTHWLPLPECPSDVS